jgi:hypothetical protein
MIRNILSGAVMVIALAAPAWAQDQCVTPKAPPIPDGARATQAQITTAQNELKVFAAASDIFQACLAQEVGRQKDLAKQTNVEFDPIIQAALQTKSEAQRRDAERLAVAWGASVEAFNQAQQRKQRRPASGGGGYGGGTGY